MQQEESRLELGGNAGVIVVNDANIDHALRASYREHSGTRVSHCISGQRVYVHESDRCFFTNQGFKLGQIHSSRKSGETLARSLAP